MPDPTSIPQAELGDIQILVRSGLSKLTAARFVLVRFVDPVAARAWLARQQITYADQASAALDTAFNIAFTASGLAALGVGQSVLDTCSPEFLEGMVAEHRSRLLGDDGPAAPARWRWGQDPAKLHAVLLLYGTPAAAERWYDACTPGADVAVVEAPIETVPLSVPGDANAQPLEHFGFRDGMAQPRLPFEGLSAPEGDAYGGALAPGEILLGYANEYGNLPRAPTVSSASDPQRLLATAPDGAGGDFGRNGTYLVVRQLQQKVREFWQFMEESSDGSVDGCKALAAKMVGRWPDGRPLAQVAPGAEEDFGFAADPEGAMCPHGAHTRRSNPRDWIPGRSADEAVMQTRRHRLLRRGRPYGPPLDPNWNIEAILRGAGTDDERGLVFLCLNADIARQFEFVQSTWINSPKFAALESDADPILGPRPRTFTYRADGSRKRLRGLPRFVDVRGGGYFFLPSRRAIAWLAGGAGG